MADTLYPNGQIMAVTVLDSDPSVPLDVLYPNGQIMAVKLFGPGGGGTPGGNNTDIQFNNSGVFGGSDRLTWNGTTFGVYDGFQAVSTTASIISSIPVITWNADPAGNYHGYIFYSVLDCANHAAGGDINVEYISLDVYNVNMTNFPVTTDSGITALVNNLFYESGVGGAAKCLENFAAIYGGSLNYLIGNLSQLGFYGGSVLSVRASFYAARPILGGGIAPSSIPMAAAYYAPNWDGAAANPYFLWFDSPAVYNIRTNAINAQQAAPAFYNSSLGIYHPGDTNFERCVQQWNISVHEFGTEAGGTGTLRDLRFIGAQMRFGANAVPDVSGTQALGTTSLMWANLFLKSGATINFNNGDVIATHSSGILTLSGSAANGINLTLGAGGTSRGPLTFQVGSLVTTANDGDIEMDANCFYACTDAGNRGYLPVVNMIRQHADRAAFANNTSFQAIFDSVTNGTLTLETGAYEFEAIIQCKNMSNANGNMKFSLAGAGTATLASILYITDALDSLDDVTPNTSDAALVSETISAQTVTNMAVASTATTCTFYVKGSFEVTVAGTIIPSIAQTTATTTAQTTAGSFFKTNRIGSTSVAAVGQWS